jgi:hypothetical protein
MFFRSAHPDDVYKIPPAIGDAFEPPTDKGRKVNPLR